jgi:conjugal transfer/entry exclusion protein
VVAKHRTPSACKTLHPEQSACQCTRSALQTSLGSIESSLHMERRSVKDLMGALSAASSSLATLPDGAGEAAKAAALQDEVLCCLLLGASMHC